MGNQVYQTYRGGSKGAVRKRKAEEAAGGSLIRQRRSTGRSVRASSWPLRPRTSLCRTGMPVPSTPRQSVGTICSSGTTWLPSSSAICQPKASAVLSNSLVSMFTPPSSASKSDPSSKLTIAGARPGMCMTPGDNGVWSIRRAPSLGTRLFLHFVQ